jgi:hypothetical protein
MPEHRIIIVKIFFTQVSPIKNLHPFLEGRPGWVCNAQGNSEQASSLKIRHSGESRNQVETIAYWMPVVTGMTLKTLLQNFLNTQNPTSDRILEHKSPSQFIDGQPVGDRIHAYTPPTEHDVDL